MKTPEQLAREIAYYAQQIQKTKSADRIRRAHVAIRRRERQLVLARRVRAGLTDHPTAADPADSSRSR